MTEDTTKTAGTTAQNGGDAAGTPTTGTPAAADRDATSGKPTVEELEKQLRDKQAIIEANKGTVEKANRLIREAQERVAPAPAASTSQAEEDVVDWRAVEKFAKEGDPVAKAQLAIRQQLLLDRHDHANAAQAREMRLTPEQEAAAKAHLDANLNRLGDLRAAHNELVAAAMEQENQDLREKLRLANVNRPDPNTIPTATREVTAAQLKGTITSAEFERDRRRLPMHEQMLQQKALLDGTLSIKD